MSDNGAAAFPTQQAVTCGFCGVSNDLTWFCKSCAESLCNACKISHPSIPMFKKHTVIPRTNDVMRLYGPSKIAEQCKIHPDKDISTYCNDCKVPCCASCLVQNHQRHEMSTIGDKYLSTENRLDDRVNELEKDVIPTLDKMAFKVKEDRSERRVQIDRVKKEINTFRKELKRAVDDSCDYLIEKLDRNDIEFDNLIAKLDAKKSEVRELIKEINEIIQKGDLSMIKYSPTVTHIPKIFPIKLTIPVFSPGEDILTAIKEKIGTVEWTDRNSLSDHSQSLTVAFEPSMIHINKVTSFNSKMVVTSITTADNNTAWVMSNCSDTMYLYNSSGKVVRSIKVKGSNGIHDMVLSRSGEMTVTCQDMKVRRVSVSGKVSTLIDTSPFVPIGVCLTESEDVVGFISDGKERNHVVVFSPDSGRKLRGIKGIDDHGKQQITDPYRVVYNGKDLCVVNVNPGNVVCVGERGDVRWVYDGKEAKLAKSFAPREISVDKYNNLLVTDYNNICIHYIDREGRLIQVILKQEQAGLYYHWGLCVDNNTGHVWVGSPSGTVVICKYLS